MVEDRDHIDTSGDGGFGEAAPKPVIVIPDHGSVGTFMQKVPSSRGTP